MSIDTIRIDTTGIDIVGIDTIVPEEGDGDVVIKPSEIISTKEAGIRVECEDVS